jgi:hypothetical protein
LIQMGRDRQQQRAGHTVIRPSGRTWKQGVFDSLSSVSA